jgi:putative FmdB family regulatory protein
VPIYEYQCDACGHRLEKIQKMADDPLTDCPACETASLKKLVSAAAFRLKGTGWYETDFKTGKKRNVSGTSSTDSSGGSDGGSPDSGSSGSGSSNSDSSSGSSSDSSSGSGSDSGSGSSSGKGGDSKSSGGKAGSGSTSGGGSKAAAS